MTFAILADGRPSIALVAPAFLACALFAYEVVCQITYCSTTIATHRLSRTQQFVLLIQQVQAPEDLAAALPPPTVPAPQATSPTQPVTPPEAAPTNTVPTNAQDANATTPTPENVSFFSIVRFIIQLAWYDGHNRICTFPFPTPAL